jgi:hypothetical protein
MRYLLLREGRKASTNVQALRVIGGGALLALLFVGSAVIANGFGIAPLSVANPPDALYLLFYWGLVALQLLLRLLALSTTSGVIAAEMRHGTWDTLKITTDGALLTMKARWATAFYRLWALLAVVVVLRVVFIGVALFDLSTFQGRYLDLLLSGTVPFGPPNIAEDTSIVIGILIVAVMMTTAILAPFTAMALDASLGMVIATVTRGRLSGSLGQVGLIIVRLLITVWALWVGATALSLTPTYFADFALATATPDAPPILGWLGAFFGVAEGDLSLTLLHLPHVQRIWADHDYGILVGVAALGWVLLQALAANFLIRWAGRRATRADRV